MSVAWALPARLSPHSPPLRLWRPAPGRGGRMLVISSLSRSSLRFTPSAAGRRTRYMRSQLQRQLGFLKRSCEDFDAGQHDEGLRIAVSLRVLFHDTSASTSLL